MYHSSSQHLSAAHLPQRICAEGITDIPELVVIDETTQCEHCKEHNAKVKSYRTCGVTLHGFSEEKTKTLKETAAQVMILANQDKRSRQGTSARKVKNTKTRSIIS